MSKKKIGFDIESDKKYTEEAYIKELKKKREQEKKQKTKKSGK